MILSPTLRWPAAQTAISGEKGQFFNQTVSLLLIPLAVAMVAMLIVAYRHRRHDDIARFAPYRPLAMLLFVAVVVFLLMTHTDWWTGQGPFFMSVVPPWILRSIQFPIRLNTYLTLTLILLFAVALKGARLHRRATAAAIMLLYLATVWYVGLGLSPRPSMRSPSRIPGGPADSSQRYYRKQSPTLVHPHRSPGPGPNLGSPSDPKPSPVPPDRLTFASGALASQVVDSESHLCDERRVVAARRVPRSEDARAYGLRVRGDRHQRRRSARRNPRPFDPSRPRAGRVRDIGNLGACDATDPAALVRVVEMRTAKRRSADRNPADPTTPESEPSPTRHPTRTSSRIPHLAHSGRRTSRSKWLAAADHWSCMIAAR